MAGRRPAPPGRPGIFINYRHADALPHARLLQVNLRERFPDAPVFMDLDSIEAGLDFAKVISDAINECRVMVVLIGLVIAAVISATVGRHEAALVGFVWIAWAFPLIWLVFKVWEWSQDYFIVTSRRMLLATGVVTRKVAMMPLVKVTDMSFQRSTLGRLLGYGEFILESAGQDQALRVVDYLPYPEQLYLEVCGLIFPGRKDDGDD